MRCASDKVFTVRPSFDHMNFTPASFGELKLKSILFLYCHRWLRYDTLCQPRNRLHACPRRDGKHTAVIKEPTQHGPALYSPRVWEPILVLYPKLKTVLIRTSQNTQTTVVITLDWLPASST